MAEFILKDMARRARMADRLLIASAATSDEEVWDGVGSPVYAPARKELARHGLDCGGKTARLMRRADYEHYDMLIGMDHMNLRAMQRICGGDPDGKLSLLLDYTDRPGREIPDPWYTRDFAAAYRAIEEGCRGLMRYLAESGAGR